MQLDTITNAQLKNVKWSNVSVAPTFNSTIAELKDVNVRINSNPFFSYFPIGTSLRLYTLKYHVIYPPCTMFIYIFGVVDDEYCKFNFNA